MNVPLLAIPYIYLTYFEDPVHASPKRHLLRLPVCGCARLRCRHRARPCGSHATAGDRSPAWSLPARLRLLVALSINQTASGFVLPLIAGIRAGDRCCRWTTVRWGRNAFCGASPPQLVVIGPGCAMAAAGAGVASHARWRCVGARTSPDEERAALEQQFSLTCWRAELEPHCRRERVELRADERRPGQRPRAGDPSRRSSTPEGSSATPSRCLPQPPAERRSVPRACSTCRGCSIPGAALFAAAALFVWTIGLVAPAVAGVVAWASAAIAQLERVHGRRRSTGASCHMPVS